tara:strand:+ start:890 stop:4894 length:4005 start_codon:yes stop_codon:yes gene_type:complete
MAKKDTVFIDIQTSDGGSMQKVAVSAKKLGLALDDAGVATTRLGKSSRTADRNLKGTANMTANGTKQFSKMSQGITGGLVPAYAVLASNVFAITAAFQFLKTAADFRVTQDSQLAFTAATGVGMQTLTRDIQAASGEMLNFQAAAEAASIGVASGLGSGQIEALAAGAGNLSKILGRDVTDSFNRLVRGVTKAEPELLDELGITLRLADATEAYASKLGKRADELTKFERKQAVFNDVQDQLEEKFNRVSKVTDVQANSIARLGVAFDNVLKDIKRYTNAISEPAAEFFTRNIQSLSVAMAFLAVPIVKSIIPGLNDFAETSREAADKASKAFEETTREMKELELQAKKIEALEGGPGKAAQSVIPKTGGGKGGDALRRGEVLSGRQLSAALRDAKLNKGVITKMSEDNKKIYRASLEAMKRDTKGFVDYSALQFEKAANAADRSAKRWELRFKKAAASIQGAFAVMGKGINLIFKGLGLIGLGLLLKDLGMELGKFLGVISESRAVLLIQEDANTSISAMKTLNSEFVKFNDVQKEMGENTLSSFSAIGLRIGQTTAKIKGALTLLREMRDLEFAQERRGVEIFTDEDANKLKSLQKELAEIPEIIGAQLTDPNQSFIEKFASSMVYGGIAQGGDLSQIIPRTDEQIEAYDKLTKQIDLLEKKQSDYLTFQKKFSAGFDESTVILNEVKRTFNDLTIFFAGLSRPLTEAEQKYKKVLDKLKGATDEDFTKILTPSDIQILIEAGKEISRFGALAADTRRSYSDLSASYREQVSGIGQYQTSVSGLIKELKEFQKAEGAVGAEGFQKRIDKATEMLTLLQKIHKVEIGNASALLRAESALVRESLGRSSIELAVIDRKKKILKLEEKLKSIQDKINLGKDKEIQQDAETIENLEAQQQLAKDNLLIAERKARLDQRVFDAGIDTLGTGLSKNIASILKGEQSSIKQAVLGLLKSVVDSMIDTFSLGIAESIMGALNSALKNTFLAPFVTLPGQAGTTAALDEFALAGGTKTLRVTEMSPHRPPVPSTEDMEKKLTAVVQTLNEPGGLKVHVENAAGIAQEIHKALEACICHTEPGEEKKEDVVEKITNAIQEGFNRRVPAGDLGTGTETGAPGTEPIVMQLTPSIEGNTLETALIRTSRSVDGNSDATDIGTTIFSESLVTHTKDFGSMFNKGVFDLRTGMRALARALEEGGGGGSAIAGFFEVIAKGFQVYSAATTGVPTPEATAKSGRIPRYARGGVVSGPESGFPAVLHGDEAVVPLPDGRSIPVMMKGGGAQQNNVGITVNIDNNGGAKTSSESDSQEAARLGDRLADLVQEELLNQKRNGGILSPYGVA